MNIYAVTLGEDLEYGPAKIEQLKTELLYLEIEKKIIEQKILTIRKQIKEWGKENEI